MRLRLPTVEELVSEWLSGVDCMMFDSVCDDPEAVWQAVLRLMEHNLSVEQIALLAAGPVEDLLVRHGTQFIERIEAEARRSSAFAHLLGGVWRQDMPSELWQRVDAARGGKVW